MLLAVLELHTDERMQGRSGRSSDPEKGHNARGVYAQEGGFRECVKGFHDLLKIQASSLFMLANGMWQRKILVS